MPSLAISPLCIRDSAGLCRDCKAPLRARFTLQCKFRRSLLTSVSFEHGAWLLAKLYIKLKTGEMSGGRIHLRLMKEPYSHCGGNLEETVGPPFALRGKL